MSFLKSFPVLTLFAALALSAPARADIPPDDQCSAADEGEACDNVLDAQSGSELGVCRSTTCTRATPDGAVTYGCFRCLPVEAGGGGQGNEAGRPPTGAAGDDPSGGRAGSSSSSSGAPTQETTPSSDGGCSVAGARGGASLGLLSALGLALVALRRRARES